MEKELPGTGIGLSESSLSKYPTDRSHHLIPYLESGDFGSGGTDLVCVTPETRLLIVF